MGHTAYNRISGDKTILLRVKLIVRGFDQFKKRNFSKIDPNVIIYSFNFADILIGNQSLVVCGYDKSSDLYTAPVEISSSTFETNIHKATLTSWYKDNGMISLKISDPSYTKPFIITLKEEIDTIEKWLQKIDSQNLT